MPSKSEGEASIPAKFDGVRSMTGFGHGEVEANSTRVTAEIRSLNGRFCEVSVRLPRGVATLETGVIEAVQKRVKRGRVNVNIAAQEAANGAVALVVDTDLARQYRNLLARLKAELGLAGEVDLSLVAGLSDVVRRDADERDLEVQRPLIEAAVEAALDEMICMREAEGTRLAQDLAERCERLVRLVETIERATAGRADARMERLRERLAQLVAPGTPLDPQRLELEVALLAERSDVVEELVRLRSHIEGFMATLSGGGDMGRRLGFLLQEIQREVNTIGAKAADVEVSGLTVEVKEEVERLREQVQNLE